MLTSQCALGLRVGRTLGGSCSGRPHQSGRMPGVGPLSPQTTQAALAGSTACRPTAWTRARWALTTRARRRSTSPREVRPRRPPRRPLPLPAPRADTDARGPPSLGRPTRWGFCAAVTLDGTGLWAEGKREATGRGCSGEPALASRAPACLVCEAQGPLLQPVPATALWRSGTLCVVGAGGGGAVPDPSPQAARSPLSLLACRRASVVPDYSRGFGGKYGVDKDKVDKSAVGFEYQGKTEKHESQKGGYHVTSSPPLALTRWTVARAGRERDPGLSSCRRRPSSIRPWAAEPCAQTQL